MTAARRRRARPGSTANLPRGPKQTYTRGQPIPWPAREGAVDAAELLPDP